MRHKVKLPFKGKIIISDFDGTLVSKKVPVLKQETINAVREWTNKGNLFTIATGRAMVKELIFSTNQLGIKIPIIINGGADLYDPLTSSIIYYKHIDENVSINLIKLFSKLELNFIVVKDNKILAPNYCKNLPLKFVPESLESINSLDEISKIRVFDLTLKEFLEIETVNEFKDKLNIVNSDIGKSKGIDITHHEATKYFAVRALCKRMKFLIKDTIAIGDDYNDIPLLSACKYRVAVEGSPKELIKIADKTIANAEHQGLADLVNYLL